MSLNWDLTEIEDSDGLFEERADGERYLDAVTNCFIWTSLVTGLGPHWKLDDTFAPEFYARIKLLEKVGGSLLNSTDGETVTPYWITWDDVKRRIGLKTNAGTKTRAQFIKSAVIVDMDRWVREAKADPRPAGVRKGSL